MREIKFRATRKKLTGGSADILYFTLDDLVRGRIDLAFVDWYNIVQYIGLKDKTGREIYEGDIIDDRSAASYHTPYAIYYCENNIRFCGGRGKSHSFHTNWPDKELEECFTVIGNIYENPELLKV